MKKLIIVSQLILFLLASGCKPKKQDVSSFSFELEDSDETYIMDNWSEEKKQLYYYKVKELILDEFSKNKYIPNVNSLFAIKTLNNLGIDISHDLSYKHIPYHIFELDSSNGYKPKILVLDYGKLLSFQSELPLLDSLSVKRYKTSDYVKLTKESPNIILNKLIFSTDDELLDEIENSESIDEIMSFLIFNFHFKKHKILFRKIITKVINETNKYKPYELMQLLTYRKQYSLDEIFVKEVFKIDTAKVLYPHFINAIDLYKSKLGEGKTEELKAKVKDIYYNSKSIYSLKEIIKGSSNMNYYVFDFNEDNFSDLCFVDSKNNILIYKGVSINNISLSYINKSALTISNLTCPNPAFSRLIGKDKYFTIEKNNCSNNKFYYEYITFKYIDDQILLHKYGIEYTDRRDPDKMIPTKIWTTDDFGEIKFEDVTEELLTKVIQSNPK